MSAPARKPHQTYISNDLLTKHCCTHPLYTYEGCRFQDRYSKSWIWLDHTFWIMWGPSGKWFRFSFGIPWNLRSPWNVIIVHGDDIIHRKWGQHPNINSPFKTATFLDSKSWDKEGENILWRLARRQLLQRVYHFYRFHVTFMSGRFDNPFTTWGLNHTNPKIDDQFPKILDPDMKVLI